MQESQLRDEWLRRSFFVLGVAYHLIILGYGLSRGFYGGAGVRLLVAGSVALIGLQVDQYWCREQGLVTLRLALILPVAAHSLLVIIAPTTYSIIVALLGWTLIARSVTGEWWSKSAFDDTRAPMLVSVVALLALSTLPDKSPFDRMPQALILAALALLTSLRWSGWQHVPYVVAVLLSCWWTSMAFGVALFGGAYLENETPFKLIIILILVATLTSGLYLLEASTVPESPPRWLLFRQLARRKFVVLVALAFLMREIVLLAVPTPVIDVFDLMQRGCAALTRGQNPYKLDYPSIYETEAAKRMRVTAPHGYPKHFRSYPYLPSTLVASLPGWLLLRDVRQSYVAAELIVMMLWLAMMRGATREAPLWARHSAELLVLLHLYQPYSLQVLHNAWTEPFLLLYFTAFVYFARRRRRPWDFAALGVAVANKQYAVFFLPFIPKSSGLRFRHWLVAIISSLVSWQPFLFWNPGFVKYLYWTHLSKVSPRPDALSLVNFLQNTRLHWHLNQEMGLVIVAVICALLWRVQSSQLSGYVLAVATSLLWFFLLGKQSFLNYFWFITACLLLTMLLFVIEVIKASSADESEPYHESLNVVA